jgi:hypothetical protein
MDNFRNQVNMADQKTEAGLGVCPGTPVREDGVFAAIKQMNNELSELQEVIKSSENMLSPVLMPDSAGSQPQDSIENDAKTPVACSLTHELINLCQRTKAIREYMDSVAQRIQL